MDGAAGRLMRAGRLAARWLRRVHEDQVLAWEIYCRAGQPHVPQTGPLTWVLTLDGYKLGGSYLPGPVAADRPGPERRSSG